MEEKSIGWQMLEEFQRYELTLGKDIQIPRIHIFHPLICLAKKECK